MTWLAAILSLLLGVLLYFTAVGMQGELDSHNDVTARVEGWSPGRRRAKRLAAWVLPLPFLIAFVWLAGAAIGVW